MNADPYTDSQIYICMLKKVNTADPSNLTCRTFQREWRYWKLGGCVCRRFRDRRGRCHGGRGSGPPAHSEPPGEAHWGPPVQRGAEWDESPFVRQRKDSLMLNIFSLFRACNKEWDRFHHIQNHGKINNGYDTATIFYYHHYHDYRATSAIKLTASVYCTVQYSFVFIISWFIMQSYKRESLSHFPLVLTWAQPTLFSQ